MGIYITLQNPIGVSPMEMALARLEYCYTAMRYFEKVAAFKPETLKIWTRASTEALGGTLLEERPANDSRMAYEYLKTQIRNRYYVDLYQSIIVFEGTWDFDDIKLAGFFSAHNYYGWISMYHDVEIDAYGRAGYEDLIDVFMKKGEVEGLATSFFSELEQTESAVRARPTTMFFSIGSPELEVDSLIALHINNWSNLIRLLYSRLREEEEAWVKGQVAPIDRGFFIENIRSNESVESNRKRMLEGASLIEVPQQSVTYIARNRESFAKFYETFKEEVFRPAAENLPEAKVLKESIDKGLQKKLGRGGLLKD